MNSFTIHHLDLHLRVKESVNLQNCQCKIDNIDIYNVNVNQELEVHLFDPHLLLSLVGKARDDCDEIRNECPCICCHRINALREYHSFIYFPTYSKSLFLTGVGLHIYIRLSIYRFIIISIFITRG